MLFLIALALAIRLISLGGGIYETAIVDKAWPSRPDIIRPAEGGIQRKVFWIPAHVMFELVMVAAIVVAWSSPGTWAWLIGSLSIHAVMRGWSFVRFIPQALAFEKGAPEFGVEEARRWVRASRLRLLLDIASAGAVMAALVTLPALP